MSRWRSRVIVVNAFRVGYDEEPAWMRDGTHKFTRCMDPKLHYFIETLEGTMEAEYGNFIILGLENEIYPCKESVFHKKYERITDDNE